ncbi:MAG: MBL fold metallo-hydrolase [Prevotellaceae bacterium]|nr:MBL fold metallo-hydrolase [Prevotellaceae bacterium]
MKKNLLLTAVMFAALLLNQQAMAQSHEVIEKDGMKMHIITSKPVIFEVTSVLLEGKNEAVLIDAQFSKEDAQRVVDIIKATGKELTTIFISYSDPDYYFGLDHIAKQFPKAKIYATAQTAYLINATKDEKTAIWSPQLGNNAPEKIIVPTAINDDHFMFEDKRIEIKKIVNDEQHSFLWIPTARTILGGIYLCDAEHLWVADSPTKEDRAKWIAGLDVMEKLNPDYAIPAHFTAKKENLKGNASILFTKHYLTALEKALDSSTNSAEVIQKMKTLYPNLAGVSNLEMTAKVLKGETLWKTAAAFPAIGRKVEVNFGGDYVFELNFEDGKYMSFVGIKGSLKGSTDRVAYTAVEIAPKVYMVYWSEPKNKSHVVHVEDFGLGVAYTNISAPDGSFTNLKGTLKLLDNR